MKIFIPFLLFLLSVLSTSFAQDYSVISISGFLETKNHTNPQKHEYSAIHHDYNENLDPLIKSRFRFNHGVSKKKLKNAIKEIGCKKDGGAGLVIVTNSWGSRKAHILSELYMEICKEPSELFIQIDGVAKPIGPQKRIPLTKNCINYYQTQTPILRGGKTKGCENRFFNNECTKENKKFFENCHMFISRMGAQYAQRDIHDFIQYGNTHWYESEKSLKETVTCPKTIRKQML